MPFVSDFLSLIIATKRSVAIQRYRWCIKNVAGGKALLFSICRRIILTSVALYWPLGIFVRKLSDALLLKISRHLSGSTLFVYENSFGIRAILPRLSAITIWFTVLFAVLGGNEFIQQIISASVLGSSLINKIFSSIIICSFLVLGCLAF